ncbi:hypothetical protein [Bacteriovorax sp. DB6_IX]|uniref:hypothetical protein n=1 Tax=Bacteriovorax sp. DB6_IX TaxID=1353530 RepID=UPI000389FD32|nr:hypothetical protein [Bacteriovorax sp. DB6_IX]EQC43176.1 hypothetical protein M901_3094 [Bacteriovorax sp. DB6_IX]
MKLRNLLFPLLVLTAFNSSAQIQTVKVSDGTTAYCKKDYDVYRRANMNGVYRAKAQNIKVTEDGKIEVEIAMAFLRCAATKSGYQFIAHSPLSPATTKAIQMNGALANINIETKDATPRVFKDGDYSLLQKSELADKSLQIQKVTLPLEKVLNSAQEQKLNETGKTNGNFDIFIHKNISIVNEMSQKQFNTTATLGAFRIHFSLEETANGTKAKLK